MGEAQYGTYFSQKKKESTIDFVSRFLEETSKAAARQQ